MSGDEPRNPQNLGDRRRAETVLQGVRDQLEQSTIAIQELRIKVAEMTVKIATLIESGALRIAEGGKFEDRLRSLESSRSMMQGAIAVLGVLWSLMVALIIWKLK